LEATKKRLEELTIAKMKKREPDTAAESIKAEIIRIDGEIRKLMDKIADADGVLFQYINDRINELHNKKSALELEFQSKARKQKEIETAPLVDPLSRWDTLSIEETHALAATMINVVYVSDEDGISIDFSI